MSDRRPVVNDEGVPHLYAGGPSAEASEVASHVEAMQGVNTDHRYNAHKVFNPAVSAKQERAMRAAAAGQSRLGIPRKVGKEFLKAEK